MIVNKLGIDNCIDCTVVSKEFVYLYYQYSRRFIQVQYIVGSCSYCLYLPVGQLMDCSPYVFTRYLFTSSFTR
jgi:hypothetical protein